MPLNVKKALLKARGLAKKGKLDAAASLYAEVLEHYPQNREATKGLAGLGQPRSTTRSAGSFAPRAHVEQLMRLFNAGKVQACLLYTSPSPRD